jgi:hypothetical protein
LKEGNQYPKEEEEEEEGEGEGEETSATWPFCIIRISNFHYPGYMCEP